MRKVDTIQKNSYQYKKSYWIELKKNKFHNDVLKGF